MTRRIGNPLPFFTDKRGLPVDGGRLYVGVFNEDPELSPVTVYLDEAQTVVVEQPLTVIGGFACYNGNPVFFYVAEDAYSMRVRARDGGEVSYFPNAVVVESLYQPASAELTALAALAGTAYGRGVLTQADASALRSYLGLVAYLPAAGGNVTGNIVRADAGTHLYHNDTTLTSGRVFVTASGASDPTSLPGDIWLELEP